MLSPWGRVWSMTVSTSWPQRPFVTLSKEERAIKAHCPLLESWLKLSDACGWMLPCSEFDALCIRDLTFLSKRNSITLARTPTSRLWWKETMWFRMLQYIKEADWSVATNKPYEEADWPPVVESTIYATPEIRKAKSDEFTPPIGFKRLNQRYMETRGCINSLTRLGPF